MNQPSFSNPESSGLSAGLKYGLLASAIVIVVLAIIICTILFLKVKRIKSDLLAKEKQEAKRIILETRGEEFGFLPDELRPYLVPKIKDEDLEHIVNTTYVNYAESALLIGSNVEFEYASLNHCGYGETAWLPEKIDKENWNRAVLDFPEFFKKPPKILKEEVGEYNLIIVANATQANLYYYKNYYQNLRPNGMLIIIQNSTSLKTLKELTALLKTENIRYEVSPVKSKFLYIVKS
ncbi:BC85_0335 family putative methyltransferase [Mycoplasmopsis columbinasalis]|uniref:Methyltransferase n=1 Tax=Mycoplasmopsis columbinasalis TaxID=114880 RepID=A0A449BAA5_9BACT|nr:hypothetical protein [Mycoplasmopsis columbinasalis]VEU78089.1 Uncharacterised protein [Mycoplasmopsis columbinasalis]